MYAICQPSGELINSIIYTAATATARLYRRIGRTRATTPGHILRTLLTSGPSIFPRLRFARDIFPLRIHRFEENRGKSRDRGVLRRFGIEEKETSITLASRRDYTPRGKSVRAVPRRKFVSIGFLANERRFRPSRTRTVALWPYRRSDRGGRTRWKRKEEREQTARDGSKARKHQVEPRRAEGKSERRMADRSEDFNWYPVPGSGQAARSFCYCFFLPPFSLSFPWPLFPAPFSSKTIYRGHSGEAARSSGLFVYRGTFTEIAARCAGERFADLANAPARRPRWPLRASPVNGYVIAITAARNRKRLAGARIVSISEQLFLSNYDKSTASLRLGRVLSRCIGDDLKLLETRRDRFPRVPIDDHEKAGPELGIEHRAGKENGERRRTGYLRYLDASRCTRRTIFPRRGRRQKVGQRQPIDLPSVSYALLIARDCLAGTHARA